MGKYRKLPFGYRMEFGRVVVDQEERDWVEFIFQQYMGGASFNELTEYMRQEGVPYDRDKQWNKNMIARMLEDSRYMGEKEFPVIIDPEVFGRVSSRRESKKVPIQKTEAQKALRRKCSFPITPYIENEVLYLLNWLTMNPEQIITPENCVVNTDRLDALTTELERLLSEMPVDETATREKIMEMAVAMYEAVDPREYETYRMKEVFRKEQPRAELDADLISRNIAAVIVDSEGCVKVKLKNEQVIGRGE